MTHFSFHQKGAVRSRCSVCTAENIPLLFDFLSYRHSDFYCSSSTNFPVLQIKCYSCHHNAVTQFLTCFCLRETNAIYHSWFELNINFRSKAFISMMRQECGWFDQEGHSSAELSARLTGDAGSVQSVC